MKGGRGPVWRAETTFLIMCGDVAFSAIGSMICDWRGLNRCHEADPKKWRRKNVNRHQGFVKWTCAACLAILRFSCEDSSKDGSERIFLTATSEAQDCIRDNWHEVTT